MEASEHRRRMEVLLELTRFCCKQADTLLHRLNWQPMFLCSPRGIIYKKRTLTKENKQ